jgi:tRNA-(ms[2]io[6]A)-hydroxylase
MLCLTEPTDEAWVADALGDLHAVLIDHAHCEMKAASNALALAARHPDNLVLVRALTDLAQEEIVHFQRVIAMIGERGLALGAPPVDAYAAELRRAAHDELRTVTPVVQRLLVGALIEARSCERFKLLVEALAREDREPELRAFYDELFTAEARHFRTYVDLAVRAAGGDEPLVRRALTALAAREGAIVRKLASGDDRAQIHG